MTKSLTLISIKYGFIRILSMVTTLWGIRGLLMQIYEIFFVYGDLSSILIAQAQDELVHIVLLQQIFFISVSNFAATGYGLVLLVKPTHLVKVGHVITALAILFASQYITATYSLDLSMIAGS